MSSMRSIQFASVLVCAASLAACGSGQPAQQNAATSSAAAAPAASPLAGPHFQATVALDGQPEVTNDGKDIVVQVRVTNTGKGTFGSADAPNPVHLGAHSVNASGKVVTIDLSRGDLPQVAAGATATATIKMPVSGLLGLSAQILPVEEGIAWFNQWTTDPTTPVTVGPFARCAGANSSTVCGANGKPLAVSSKN